MRCASTRCSRVASRRSLNRVRPLAALEAMGRICTANLRWAADRGACSSAHEASPRLDPRQGDLVEVLCPSLAGEPDHR